MSRIVASLVALSACPILAACSTDSSTPGVSFAPSPVIASSTMEPTPAAADNADFVSRAEQVFEVAQSGGASPEQLHSIEQSIAEGALDPAVVNNALRLTVACVAAKGFESSVDNYASASGSGIHWRVLEGPEMGIENTLESVDRCDRVHSFYLLLLFQGGSGLQIMPRDGVQDLLDRTVECLRVIGSEFPTFADYAAAEQWAIETPGVTQAELNCVLSAPHEWMD